jgi:LmbE family N-acetylglucosaminyl deacetylase
MKKCIKILAISLLTAVLVIYFINGYKCQTYSEKTKPLVSPAPKQIQAPLNPVSSKVSYKYQMYSEKTKPAAPKQVQVPLKPAPSKNVVIYFSPHADDEVLTFGIPILNDIRVGKKVYLVLMSSGSHSFARERLNGAYDKESDHIKLAGKKLKDNLYGVFHNPYKEHYKDGWLTREKFGEARIREFYLSAAAFGIPRSQVQVFHLVNDHFVYRKVRRIFELYAKQFPDATFKTMSIKDVHPDHAMCGRVLDDLLKEHVIKHGVHYISITTDRIKKVKIPGSHKVYLANPADKKMFFKTMKAYNIWDPKHGYYAIGFHSTSIEFRLLRKQVYTKTAPY